MSPGPWVGRCNGANVRNHPLGASPSVLCRACPIARERSLALLRAGRGGRTAPGASRAPAVTCGDNPVSSDGPLTEYFEVLAYDQRGLGQSSVPPWPYGMADFADDAAALLDALGWDDCLVLGVSFGGMVAQEVAIRHPERVRRLVLACTSAGGAGGASYPLHELADRSPDERSAMRLEILDTRWDEAWRHAHPDMVAPDRGAHEPWKGEGGAAQPGPHQPAGRPGRTRHRGPPGRHQVPNPGVRRAFRRDRSAGQQRVPGPGDPRGAPRAVRRRPRLLPAGRHGHPGHHRPSCRRAHRHARAP